MVSSENNALKESPLYNLSLSSLENFHTAFLVWLGNNYKIEFLNVLKELIMPDDKSTEDEKKEFNEIKYIFKPDVKSEYINFIAQSREGANSIIDIKITIFEGGNGSDKEEANIYIENKFKSYPTQEQIEKYREQIDNNNKETRNKEKTKNKNLKKETTEDRKINNIIILLTMAPTEEITRCLKINYMQLYDKLRKIVDFPDGYIHLDKTCHTYNDYLIGDYINMIDMISHTLNEELNRKKEIKDRDMGMLTLDFYNVESDILKENEALKNVYVKYRGNEFAKYLRKEIIENNKFNNCYIKSGFNNNKATIDINFLNFKIENSIVKEHNDNNDDQSFKIGIQIEGNQYRHYIIFPKRITSAKLQEEKVQEMVSNENPNANLWFIGMKQRTEKPRKNSCFTKFYGYRKDKVPNFIYLYNEEIIVDKKSYKEILEYIKIDRDKFEKNKDNIIKILKELDNK